MRLVLAGFGVVGQSFAALLEHKEKELASAYGLVPRIVAVVDSTGSVLDERGLDLSRVVRSKKRNGSLQTAGDRRTTSEIIAQTEADVMVETTPTNFRTGEPGLGHIRAAFISKKSVITCNKGPLGIAFHALRELARHNSVEFRYSGAVGGGTPILDFGRTCSIGDEITKVTGILNGTCNFILTKMEQDHLGFQRALALAQKEGYAEKDPSLDINGFDSAVKLAIIANHLSLSRATVRDVRVKGIAEISPGDVDRAAAKGDAVRLLATADGGELSVAPVVIRRDDPLCVSGTYNAVKFHCRYSGPKVIVGKGAGGPETASSLLRDLIEIRGSMAGESTK
ncbi:MAG: homoserine dehydrogenase [Thaumarchaeota archaeon]|nr:homoserine dehydrogenase [Nitrososphaerota archaeon]